ncbi:MAG: type II toxin-antitoxin system RelE/ParE family toxin [Oscillospiraceae bacterium]|nr:type II toxin-antitoxin system RelE/ParE family toxin [Oscillospiraceae bacterium]
MTEFKVEYTPKAVKQLAKLDKSTRKLIYAWIDKNLQNCSDPRAHGKGLTANRSGQWRYRIGDYRIIADIQEDKIIILILEIGHRKDIYS